MHFPPIQDATCLPSGPVSTSSEAAVCRGGWTKVTQVLSLVTRGELGLSFSEPSGAARQRLASQTEEVRSSNATKTSEDDLLAVHFPSLL